MRLIDAEEVIEYLTAVKAELGAERLAMTGWGVPARGRMISTPTRGTRVPTSGG